MSKFKLYWMDSRGRGGTSRVCVANNSIQRQKMEEIVLYSRRAKQWKPNGTLNDMLFHFQNCFLFGIMYAHHPLLGVWQRVYTHTHRLLSALPTPGSRGRSCSTGDGSSTCGKWTPVQPHLCFPSVLAGLTAFFTSQVNCSLGLR